MQNPNAYGIPTFEQYKVARAKWNPSMDDEASMIAITDGPKKFRRDLNKLILQVNGHEMPEEQVERALSDFGYTLGDIDISNRDSKLKKDIQMVPQGGGKYDLVVNFLP